MVRGFCASWLGIENRGPWWHNGNMHETEGLDNAGSDAFNDGETREIEEALSESESQFSRGEGIPASVAWQRLGI